MGSLGQRKDLNAWMMGKFKKNSTHGEALYTLTYCGVICRAENSMMLRASLFMVCVWCVLGALSVGHVQAGPLEKQEKIKKLLSATDLRTMLDDMVPVVANLVAKDLKKKGVAISAETVDVIKKSTTTVMKTNVTPYINRIVGMYNEAYSEQEIDELLTFYSSPTGQKSLQVMSKIQNDAKSLGVKWGRSLAPQIDTDVMAILNPTQG